MSRYCSIGDKFLIKDDQYKHYYDEYILVDYDREKNLIAMFNMKNGLRWSKPVKVNDRFTITEEEYNELMQGHVTIRLKK